MNVTTREMLKKKQTNKQTNELYVMAICNAQCFEVATPLNICIMTSREWVTISHVKYQIFLTAKIPVFHRHQYIMQQFQGEFNYSLWSRNEQNSLEPLTSKSIKIYVHIARIRLVSFECYVPNAKVLRVMFTSRCRWFSYKCCIHITRVWQDEVYLWVHSCAM